MATKSLLIAAVAFGGMVVLGQSARAAFILSIAEDNGAFTSIYDNLAGDSSATTQSIVYIGALPDFPLTVTVGASDSPGSTSSNLHVTSIATYNSGTASHTLKVKIEDIGFTNPTGAIRILSDSLGGSITNGRAGDFITSQAYADLSNAQGGTSITTGLTSDALIASSPFSQSLNTPTGLVTFSGIGTYSLADVLNATISPGASLSIGGTATVTAVTAGNSIPEPASAMLLLPLAGLLINRRRSAR